MQKKKKQIQKLKKLFVSRIRLAYLSLSSKIIVSLAGIKLFGFRLSNKSLIKCVISIFVCMQLTQEKVLAQINTINTQYYSKNVVKTNDSDLNSCIMYFRRQHVCKSFSLDSGFLLRPKYVSIASIEKTGTITKEIPHSTFLQLHGNMAYNFDYRSRLDTPFAASNLQQHREQSYIDATLKGRYTFRVLINSTQSNSPYLKNYTSVSVKFNHDAFQQHIKDEMIAEMKRKMLLDKSFEKYEQLVTTQRANYAALKIWIEDPSRTQEIVEEKEAIYKQISVLNENKSELTSLKDNSVPLSNFSGRFGSLPGVSYVIPISKDSLLLQDDKKKDSLLALLHAPGETEKKMGLQGLLVDSLFKTMLSTQRSADSVKASLNSKVTDFTNQVKNARSIADLETIEKKTGINSLKGSDKTLLSVTQFGIGRSPVNYSDLTVNNISINGLNIEYNPSFYAAFTAGSVDYLFKDFIVQPGSMPKQNLLLGRFGWGNKEKRMFILTAYTGTKNGFSGNITDTSGLISSVNSVHIFGYSLEGKYKLSKNTDFSFEAAKSTSPYNSVRDRGNTLNHVFVFSDHNNEALSAKLNIYLPATRSRLNFFYKKIGADFQSYSVFNSGNRQEGWGIRWQQYLLKNQLSATLQIRKNNFDNPLIPASYNTSTIFKSLQLVYRKKKLPIFSLGYMPNTQLIKSPNGYLSQNIYYALTSGIFYNYTFRKLQMNSSLIYNRYYNKGTDTGFVFYNAKNIIYSHNINLGKLQSQSDIQYTKQPGLAYWSIQQRADILVNKYFSFGAGIKNYLLAENAETYWGGSLQTSLQFKKIGALRMQYSKDYLPNGLGNLTSNNWGRASWFKTF